MNKLDLETLLRENTYPGRGIVLGKSADGKRGVAAYFIMGRSENSRNRVFTPTADGIITEAFDDSKMVDPSLIIYAPVRKVGETLVVTNGDQTDTIRDHLSAGSTFEAALRTRTFEPDTPNYTPRISGAMARDGSYKLSILKSDNGHPDAPQRFFFEYAAPQAGEGHFIHTYRCDGNPIPSFEGEPERVALGDDPIDAFARKIWESLNEANKVSLFVRYWDLETGGEETRILNKHQ